MNSTQIIAKVKEHIPTLKDPSWQELKGAGYFSATLDDRRRCVIVDMTPQPFLSVNWDESTVAYWVVSELKK